MKTASSQLNLADDLQARGLISQQSAPLATIFEKKRKIYLGVDPTADSMHAGNLLVVLVMKRLAEAGHEIVLLVGGGTGMIGDPRESGERSLSDEKVVAKNSQALKTQLQQIIGKKIKVVNNADWLLKISLVDFLRDIGKHFTVNELIKRDIIKRRLETPDESISYTEFAYSLLQGYDFLHLYSKEGVDVQMGGNDQWTNILSGVELIRRKLGKTAYCFATPLVVDSNGKKFGKSEGNAVWLDATKTSPYKFYQFWLNLADEGIENYLKYFTFLSVTEIEALVELHKRNPGERKAQTTLARIVTELVHGKQATEAVVVATEVLYGGRSLADVSKDDRAVLLAEVSTVSVPATGMNIVDALVEGKLVSSKSDARRLIEAKGVSLNGAVVSPELTQVIAEHFISGLALLKKGKRDTAVLLLK